MSKINRRFSRVSLDEFFKTFKNFDMQALPFTLLFYFS